MAAGSVTARPAGQQEDDEQQYCDDCDRSKQLDPPRGSHGRLCVVSGGTLGFRWGVSQIEPPPVSRKTTFTRHSVDQAIIVRRLRNVYSPSAEAVE